MERAQFVRTHGRSAFRRQKFVGLTLHSKDDNQSNVKCQITLPHAPPGTIRITSEAYLKIRVNSGPVPIAIGVRGRVVGEGIEEYDGGTKCKKSVVRHVPT